MLHNCCIFLKHSVHRVWLLIGDSCSLRLGLLVSEVSSQQMHSLTFPAWAVAPFWIKQLLPLCSLLIKVFPGTEQKTDAVWGTNCLYCENSNLTGLTTEVCMHLCSLTEVVMPCMTCRGQETIEIYVQSVWLWKTQAFTFANQSQWLKRREVDGDDIKRCGQGRRNPGVSGNHDNT